VEHASLAVSESARAGIGRQEEGAGQSSLGIIKSEDEEVLT
jgi:hypothetical protein